MSAMSNPATDASAPASAEGAFVSGSLGQAIFMRDGAYHILDAPDADPRQALANEITWFRQAALEVVAAHPEGLPVSMERLRTILAEEIRFFQGLDGLLVGMDPDRSRDTRMRAIAQANGVLESDVAMARRVRQRFLVPTDSGQWDPPGGLELALERQADHAISCYRVLANGTVARLADDIADVVAEEFGSGVAAAANREALMRSELIAQMARIEDEQDRQAALSLVFRSGDFPEVKRMGRGGHVLASLQKRIVERLRAPSPAPVGADAAGNDQDNPAAAPDDPIIKAIEKHRGRKPGRRRRRRGRRDDGPNVDSINSEIDWIGQQLTLGNMARAENGLVKLIKIQADGSEPEHIMKTLTSVAALALREHRHDFAHRALSALDRVGTPDAPAMCMRAEVLRAQGHAKDALSIFDEVIERFPDSIVARNAKAGALRDLGRYEEALALLDEAIEQFPDNAVARNAKAETLRNLGRQQEALALLGETIEQFPDDEVARNAKAETLRDLGRQQEALALLDETIERFPDDPVAQNIKGGALRDLGRHGQAIEVFDDAINQFRGNTVARAAKAETLRELGRQQEALALLDETIDQFPNDEVARNVKAETLRDLGRLEEALGVLDEAIDQFRDNTVARTAKAETLRELGRLEEALELLDETIDRFPDDVAVRNAKAKAMRSLGRREEAPEARRKTINRFPR